MVRPPAPLRGARRPSTVEANPAGSRHHVRFFLILFSGENGRPQKPELFFSLNPVSRKCAILPTHSENSGRMGSSDRPFSFHREGTGGSRQVAHTLPYVRFQHSFMSGRHSRRVRFDTRLGSQRPRGTGIPRLPLPLAGHTVCRTGKK